MYTDLLFRLTVAGEDPVDLFDRGVVGKTPWPRPAQDWHKRMHRQFPGAVSLITRRGLHRYWRTKLLDWDAVSFWDTRATTYSASAPAFPRRFLYADSYQIVVPASELPPHGDLHINDFLFSWLDPVYHMDFEWFSEKSAAYAHRESRALTLLTLAFRQSAFQAVFSMRGFPRRGQDPSWKVTRSFWSSLQAIHVWKTAAERQSQGGDTDWWSSCQVTIGWSSWMYPGHRRRTARRRCG